MDYATIRALHIGCAALSIAGFAVRGVLMLRDSPLLGARFARIGPNGAVTARGGTGEP